MTHGFDTSFLVATEVSGHSEHEGARDQLKQLVAAGDDFALAPQVLAEFLHIITDKRRFARPLPMEDALERALAWWNSPEVAPIWPDQEALRLFFTWMAAHQLGRNRILDTLLAATYRSAGISSLLTTNARDFAVFGGFSCLLPLKN